MARLATLFAGVAVGAMVFASDALAVHDLGHRAVSDSGGFPWNTVALWTGIGIGVVLLATWLLSVGRHRRLPHGPVTHH